MSIRTSVTEGLHGDSQDHFLSVDLMAAGQEEHQSDTRQEKDRAHCGFSGYVSHKRGSE